MQKPQKGLPLLTGGGDSRAMSTTEGHPFEQVDALVLLKKCYCTREQEREKRSKSIRIQLAWRMMVAVMVLPCASIPTKWNQPFSCLSLFLD